MKNLKLTLFITLAVIGMTACNTNKEQIATGIICEASMNTLMIVNEQGDTLTFSTMDAERMAPEGILLGDTAKLTYTGKTEGLITATKLEVMPVKRTSPEILGEWIQPIEGMSGEQGIKIEENGVASSINMATLVYESWNLKDGQLILNGQSIGNGQTITFSDTLKVEKLTPDSLIISDGEYVARYSKKQ